LIQADILCFFCPSQPLEKIPIQVLSENSILCIFPYNHKGQWVFDDPEVGLAREPFVSGADVIIDRMVGPLENPKAGFTLLFSTHPFPGFQLELEWLRPDLGGNWYKSEDLRMEGWLCPALFKYFDQAPKKIYAQFKNNR
jgi:hypothetical protein